MLNVVQPQKYSIGPPKNGIVRIQQVNDIEGYVLCAGFFWVLKEMGSVITPTCSIIFPPKP
jgi:hypothetical protein